MSEGFAATGVMFLAAGGIGLRSARSRPISVVILAIGVGFLIAAIATK